MKQIFNSGYLGEFAEGINNQLTPLKDNENPIYWRGYSELISKLLDKTAGDISMHTSVLTETSYALPTAIVLGMHHVTTAAITIILHRSKTHGSVKLDPLLIALGETIIRPNTTIVAKEWIAAHTQHHRESDVLWNMNSDKLGDPHSPLSISKKGYWRFIKQWLDVVGKKDYFNAVDVIYKNSSETKSAHPSTSVKIEGKKPGSISRFGPSIALFGAYIASFGWEIALVMGIAQAALGSGTVTLINGVGHGADERSEGNGGNHSQNITSTGGGILGKLWNNFLSFQCVGEEHHGNHHTSMKSADITLGDPTQFDLGYYYLRKLEEVGLAWDIKVPKNKH